MALIRNLRLWTPWLGVFWSLGCFAGAGDARVSQIHYGEPTLLFLSDGQVAKVSREDSKSIDRLVRAMDGGLEIRFRLSRLGWLRSFEIRRDPEDPAPKRPIPSSGSSFSPSIVDPALAQTLYLDLNRRTRSRAQCYNRAHIWAYEAFQKRSHSSMKVFMFFTEKYIRDYDYHWWFHVAPFTYVGSQGRITETVLDSTFMRGPARMKEWSDYFIKPKTECPTAEKYSDYFDHQLEAYCFFIKVPMYYWQPKDLEALDQGTPREETFREDEVAYAYRQAFR